MMKETVETLKTSKWKGTMGKSLVFILLISNYYAVSNAFITVEVEAGHLATLPCLSNDDNHQFMFWQLSDDQHVIGPGNQCDREKYNYEVLTGKLFIRGVSSKEAGFYRCISRGVQNHSSINIHVSELLVKRKVEDEFETNLLRGMAAVSIIVVGIAVVLLIITMRRKQNRRFFDFEDSPTREDSPARYTRKNQVPTIAVGPTPLVSQGIDNVGMDVDFPRVFTQIQREPSLP